MSGTQGWSWQLPHPDWIFDYCGCIVDDDYLLQKGQFYWKVKAWCGGSIVAMVIIYLNVANYMDFNVIHTRRVLCIYSEMVKSYENDYRPNNLSLFTHDCEHNRGKKNMKKTSIYGSYCVRIVL